jgi:uncharacterized damage-inducible protein DinB
MKLSPALLTRLHHQHEAISDIIAAKPAAALMQTPAPGKWSAHDNIAHLAVYQPVFIGRMQQVLATEQPVFERYSADEDPAFAAGRKKDTTDLLQWLAAERTNLEILINSLSEAELARTGIHKKYGKLSIAQWTEFFLLHEAHHILTIFQRVNDIPV